MFIKQITIEGVEGDVEILHIDGGALVTSGNDIVCEVRADDASGVRLRKARAVADRLCGHRAAGEPNATHAMVGDVLQEIERVMGR